MVSSRMPVYGSAACLLMYELIYVNENIDRFCDGDALESLVCKMSRILFMFQCFDTVSIVAFTKLSLSTAVT